MASRKATVLERFSPATRRWFEGTFAAPTPAQGQGWEAISEGRHALILAPTGSGKTLAAFLWTLDRLLTSAPPEDERKRCRVLYVSPLKALTYDVERNLRAPLAGIVPTFERGKQHGPAQPRVSDAYEVSHQPIRRLPPMVRSRGCTS